MPGTLRTLSLNVLKTFTASLSFNFMPYAGVNSKA